MYTGALHPVPPISERKLVRMGSESTCGNITGKYIYDYKNYIPSQCISHNLSDL